MYWDEASIVSGHTSLVSSSAPGPVYIQGFHPSTAAGSSFKLVLGGSFPFFIKNLQFHFRM
jgi:hypothetical protein